MPKVAFHTNLKTTPEAAEIKTHNRWHPDIPMVETFKPGAEFRVECFDWTGGQMLPTTVPTTFATSISQRSII
jgi:formamidase